MQLKDFIRTNSVVQAPKLVPEIRPRLATELTPFWYAIEFYLHQISIDAPIWTFAWFGSQALARYIPDGSEAVARLTVIDFGSGKQDRLKTRKAPEGGY